MNGRCFFPSTLTSPPSVSFHQRSTLVSIYTLLLTEKQTGEILEPSNGRQCLGSWEHLDKIVILLLLFKGLINYFKLFAWIFKYITKFQITLFYKSCCHSISKNSQFKHAVLRHKISTQIRTYGPASDKTRTSDWQTPHHSSVFHISHSPWVWGRAAAGSGGWLHTLHTSCSRQAAPLTATRWSTSFLRTIRTPLEGSSHRCLAPGPEDTLLRLWGTVLHCNPGSHCWGTGPLCNKTWTLIATANLEDSVSLNQQLDVVMWAERF